MNYSAERKVTSDTDKAKAKHSFKKKTEEVEVVDLIQFNHLI